MLTINHLKKTYRSSSNAFEALHDVSLHLEEGEFVALVGKSGSGKTTLFNIISGIDDEYEGSCLLNGDEIKDLDEETRLALRRSEIGIIFQSLNLIDTLTVEENLKIVPQISGIPLSDEAIRDALEMFGISDKLHSFPDELSGGEKQRAVCARVKLMNPKLILADEPTGSLDEKNSELVFQYLLQFHQLGKTVLLVTHDMELAARADRIITLKDGVIDL